MPLGRDTLRRLGQAVHNFATCEIGGRASALAGLLVALLLAINGLNVVNSYVGRDFMTAIERRDATGFARMAIVYAGVFGASTAVAVIYRFVEERLGLMWREWLTRRLVDAYLGGRLYYHVQVGEGLTNPDQRIADDVRSFTTSTLSLFLVFLNGTLTIIAFSGVLWSISRLLFAVAVGYAAIGSLLAIALGRPLVRLHYDQSDREANFRAALVHVRENAESVAILRSEPQLRQRLLGQVEALAANLRHIIAVNRNLGFFTTGYGYMIQLVPALIVAPLFIRGSEQFGVIAQSSMAFAHVVGAFSLVVNQFQVLTSYAAVLARLSALVDAADAVAERPEAEVKVVEAPDRLGFERLTLLSPHDARPLVRDLSAEVRVGSRLLVVAPSDAATALERAIVGLWDAGAGRVLRPPLDEVAMLPERPYLAPGTLRASLAAGAASPAREEDLWQALAAAGVDAAVRRAGGLDVERDWDDLLSLEEQRLVVIARMLLARPRFAVLTRPEAGMGPARTAAVLAALAERGIAAVVLGESTLDRVHFDAVVRIAPDATWSATAAQEISA